MTVNYVLMYGTPYLKYKEFETFEDMSKFIVNKRIVNYTIFEKMNDEKEVEMIYRDNDIHVLESAIKKTVKDMESTLKINNRLEPFKKCIAVDVDHIKLWIDTLKLEKGDEKNEQ